jgi:hypothetical protein
MANKPVGKHLHKFLEETMQREGCSILVAASYDGARAAERRDNSELAAHQTTRTAEEFLGARKGTGFASREEREAAYGQRDAEGRKLYEVSPTYRKAIEEMAMLSTDEVMGVVRPHRNVPSNESMLKQARFEAYQEGRAELFQKAHAGGPGAARARLQLMEYDQSADPEVRAMMEANERTYADTHPLEMELRAQQAAGARVGTPLVASHEQEQAVEANPMGGMGASEPKPEPGSDWK